MPFILGGLYVSAMLLIGGAMSATGVSTAGGILMLAAPVPAIVGILVAVKVYRGAARPR